MSRAKCIMVQGTMSGAGKSVLCAGLCRIFRQDGYTVAPFKSQNMALNSYVTADGLEMGRAQVMQAAAAGLEPDVRMNPVLLKPSSDTGSQVIVNGEIRGQMTAREYFRYKRQLLPEILAAYDSLASQYDIVVIEGAGSPAEINLRAEDIVNMGLAEQVNAPVLLAGDIDRGGVFASLYGTVALLEPEERSMVKGTIINKFRGDVDILKPGLSQLEALTSVPVLGVVPWLDLDLDDEDSLSSRFSAQRKGAPLDATVVRLPRISNFTDFNALERHPAVGLRYIARVEELGSPDLVILPGTKSTLHDLRWLRQSGLEAAIQKLAAGGTPVIGICGGYQMLGESMSDPEGAEGGGQMAGMGLLPVSTVFRRDKTRTQTAGTFPDCGGFFAPLSGAPLEGYEIHMGTGGGLFSVRDRVLGTYLHGLFDSPALLQRLTALLLREKGLPEDAAGEPEDIRTYKQRQYDKLAAALRGSLDLPAIYRILDRGLEKGGAAR